MKNIKNIEMPSNGRYRLSRGKLKTNNVAACRDKSSDVIFLNY